MIFDKSKFEWSNFAPKMLQVFFSNKISADPVILDLKLQLVLEARFIGWPNKTLATFFILSKYFCSSVLGQPGSTQKSQNYFMKYHRSKA